MCMCIYVYVCMSINIYIYIYMICTCICVCIYTCRLISHVLFVLFLSERAGEEAVLPEDGSRRICKTREMYMYIDML